MNQTTLEKVINGDWNRPHERPKNKWAPTPLDDLCDLLYSPFVTLFGIVWLVLSRSFQRYWWCRNQNFNVLLGSSFFFFLSYLFSQITRRERENKERKKNRSQRHRNSNDDSSLNRSCDPLMSLLVTFLGVIGFVLSRFF